MSPLTDVERDLLTRLDRKSRSGDYAATATAAAALVRRLAAEVERLTELAEIWKESACMACENPPPGCDCPGCTTAADAARNAQ